MINDCFGHFLPSPMAFLSHLLLHFAVYPLQPLHSAGFVNFVNLSHSWTLKITVFAVLDIPDTENHRFDSLVILVAPGPDLEMTALFGTGRKCRKSVFLTIRV